MTQQNPNRLSCVLFGLVFAVLVSAAVYQRVTRMTTPAVQGDDAKWLANLERAGTQSGKNSDTVRRQQLADLERVNHEHIVRLRKQPALFNAAKDEAMVRKAMQEYYQALHMEPFGVDGKINDVAANDAEVREARQELFLAFRKASMAYPDAQKEAIGKTAVSQQTGPP